MARARVRRGSLERAFSDALRRAREDAGLTQEGLAFLCGIHPTYISQLERGVKTPSLRTVWKMAEALGKRPYQFVKSIEEA